jgi:hypothetical protein
MAERLASTQTTRTANLAAKLAAGLNPLSLFLPWTCSAPPQRE